MEGKQSCALCGVITLALLLVILLPMSFAYIDYWEYGLKQRKSTGKVYTDKVYAKGRYFVGPDYKFLKYQADAHLEHLEDVAVFSDGGEDSVGLSFLIDVDFTYFLKEDEIGKLHKDLAKTYAAVILSRTIDGIKNSATTVSFTDYFQNREGVELQFREAVQKRWDFQPSLHATLDQFHVGRIKIPDSVADKQLSAKIQVEKNKEEEFLQSARIEREITAVEVNQINLKKEKLLRSTAAEASLITANAFALSDQIKNGAINNGTKALLDRLGITSEEHSTAYTYIRTLQNRQNLGLSVSYLADSNIVKTMAQPVVQP
mmetsp:Transcript_8916/g.13486  ORF Transcript_8916/g.13486 Transcript_8916/m.13486 type:complete len:317 (+) Transcript_8916:76-1026(+)